MRNTYMHTEDWIISVCIHNKLYRNVYHVCFQDINFKTFELPIFMLMALIGKLLLILCTIPPLAALVC